MTRSTLAIFGLTGALFVSNAWWVYRALDQAVGASYQADSLQEHRQALVQALAVLPVAARASSTRSDVLDAAAANAPDTEPFEKDGFTWVGYLGFRFGADGRTVAVAPSWEPFP